MGNLERVAMGSALGFSQQLRIEYRAASVSTVECDKPIRSRYIDALERALHTDPTQC